MKFVVDNFNDFIQNLIADKARLKNYVLIFLIVLVLFLIRDRLGLYEISLIAISAGIIIFSMKSDNIIEKNSIEGKIEIITTKLYNLLIIDNQAVDFEMANRENQNEITTSNEINEILKKLKPKKILINKLRAGRLLSFFDKNSDITILEDNMNLVSSIQSTEKFYYLNNKNIKIEPDIIRNYLKRVNEKFDVIILNNYKKIPIYYTYEAISLYIEKLSENGIILIKLEDLKSGLLEQISSIISHAKFEGFYIEQDFLLNKNYKLAVEREKKFGLATNKKKKQISKLEFFNKVKKYWKIIDDSFLFPKIPDKINDHYIIIARQDIEKKINLSPVWQKLPVTDMELMTDNKIGFNEFRKTQN